MNPPPIPRLADVEVLARRFPRTFQIPSRHDRETLRIGQLAKLIFGDRERMWVLVDRVDDVPRRCYRGLLQNVSVCFDHLDYETPIEFGPEHVIDIEDGIEGG